MDDERRARDTAGQIEELSRLDLHARDLDLRSIEPHRVAAAVGDPDFLWVRGGNVFTLRMAMSASGFDDWLRAALAEDRTVHAGYSAGACVLAPSLRGLELCDPVEECMAAYGDVRFDGLGILDRPVVPHLDSPAHPSTELLARVADEYDSEGQPYWALRDGEALIVDGGEPTIH